MPRQLTSKRMLKSVASGAANVFPTPCARIFSTETQDGDTGEVVLAYFADEDVIYAALEDYTGIQEVRRPDQTIVLQPVQAALNGYYPAFTVLDKLRAYTGRDQAGYTDYDILSVHHDSTNSFTMLMLEKASSTIG